MYLAGKINIASIIKEFTGLSDQFDFHGTVKYCYVFAERESMKKIV